MKPILTMIALAIALPLASLAVPDCQAEPSAAPTAPYDAELYGLGYDVFLANNNPGDAFALAERALVSLPDDPLWRRRAAQSGEWSGHFIPALDNWFYLATVKSDRQARQNALRLARELRDFRKLRRLLEPGHGAGGAKELREYVAACEALGLPDDAIAVLDKQRHGQDGKYALENLARLQEAVGHPEKAVATWLDLAARYGVTASILLKASSLAYGTGDLQSAYTILKLGNKGIPPQEYEYWGSVSDLDWAMQDARGAVSASRLLVQQGHGRDVDYQRLIAAGRTGDVNEAYWAALEGWRRFRSPAFFFAMVETGLTLNRQAELVALVKEAGPAGELKKVEGYPYYWMLMARLQLAAGNRSAAIRCYRDGLGHFPGDGQLAAGYIWLLIDLEQRRELRSVLLAWNGREKSLPELYDPCGAGYLYLGEYQRALPFYKARYAAMHGDPSWLAVYAEVLEQSGRPEAAFYERLQALRLTRSRMKSSGAVGEDDRKGLLRDYARLAMLVEPGDALAGAMGKIVASRQDDASRELVAAWALSGGHNDFARLWYWGEYAKMTRRPRWVELALALEANDHDRIGRLLSQDLDRLPYRDAIEGLRRIGWTGEAETYAFDKFQLNDRDYLLDQQVRELFNAHPAWFGYRMAVMDQAGVGFLEQRLSLSHPLSPRLALRIDAANTDIRHLKTGILGFYPESAQSVQVGMALRHEKGTAEASAGLYDGLSSHVMATLRTDWKLSGTLGLDLALHMGAEASETVLLKVGGMKDEASIALQDALTPRDSAMLRYSVRSLRDQDRHELGQGTSFEGELNHRLLVTWPDTTLRVFGGYHYYARTGTPVGKALRLIPGGIADAAYYVPLSFAQTGFGITVGEEGRSSYIRHWRPFGAADANWNSTSSFGFRYEVGLVGPIFGLDKLEGAFSQESGSFGTSDMISRFDLRYRYHFD